MTQRRALIVDGEPETCELIRKVVTAAGMEAQIVRNTSQASELLNAGKFDLVFLEFAGSPHDGLQVARQMRRSRVHRSSTIVVLSEDQRPGAIAAGFAAGATFFVYKPIEKVNLGRLVRAVQGAVENDKRRTRRVSIRNNLSLRCGGQEISGVTIDMSLCGMLVMADQTFPPGSKVKLTLTLPSGLGPITGKGSVARIGAGNQMGIQFDSMGPMESEKLQESLLPLVPAAEILPAFK